MLINNECNFVVANIDNFNRQLINFFLRQFTGKAFSTIQEENVAFTGYPEVSPVNYVNGGPGNLNNWPPWSICWVGRLIPQLQLLVNEDSEELQKIDGYVKPFCQAKPSPSSSSAGWL